MDQKTWNCIYHPIHKMRVVTDEEKETLVAGGEWFDHPTKAKEAKELREKKNEQVHEKHGLHPKGRKRVTNHKQSSENGSRSAL